MEGGVAPYTWSVTQGSLPPGMTLNGGGILSGTPASTGTFSFTVAVQDSSPTRLSSTLANFTIMVTQPTTLLSVSSQRLNFSYTPGDPNPPASQNIGVLSSPGSTSISTDFNTSDGGTWLDATPSFSANSTTPGTITVSVNPANLAPSTTYIR